MYNDILELSALAQEFAVIGTVCFVVTICGIFLVGTFIDIEIE